jgi:CheY-like chemotaxis protein
MDLQMPEMDGFTATKLLRAKPEFRELPIIAMSADAMTEAVQRCLEAGMNDHIGKPFVPDALFATLGRWTHGHARSPSELPAEPRGVGQEAILPEMEGLDMSAGLQRVAGNKRLYRDLLTQFVAKHESTGNRIKEALECGDRNLVERLVHSLKGVAGNLGINRIFVLAGTLEKALRESHIGTRGLIDELTSALDRQIRAIRAVLSVDSVDGGKRFGVRPAERAEALTAIARLRERLEKSAADAPRAFTDLAEILQRTVVAWRLDALGAAVKAFDFDAALAKLDEISDQYRSDGS